MTWSPDLRKRKSETRAFRMRKRKCKAIYRLLMRHFCIPI